MKQSSSAAGRTVIVSGRDPVLQPHRAGPSPDSDVAGCGANCVVSDEEVWGGRSASDRRVRSILWPELTAAAASDDAEVICKGIVGALAEARTDVREYVVCVVVLPASEIRLHSVLRIDQHVPGGVVPSTA